MKTKRLSLLMAVIMSLSLAVPAFAADITSSGGTQSVPVELTAEAATFSVTVPTALPISVDATGKVTTATDTKIVNASHGAVIVSNMTIAGANDWATADYDSLDTTTEKVGTKKVAMTINNDKTTGANAISFTQSNFPVLEGANETTSDELAITYSAKIPAQSAAISDATVANVVFTVGWYI